MLRLLYRMDCGGVCRIDSCERNTRITSTYHLSDGCVQTLFYYVFVNYLILHCQNLTTYFIFSPRIEGFGTLRRWVSLKFYRQTANCDIRIATPPADIMWRLRMMLFL